MSNPFPLTEKLARLEEIERYFTGVSVDLEQGMKLQEEAAKLAEEILAYLAEAKSKVESVSLPKAGNDDRS